MDDAPGNSRISFPLLVWRFTLISLLSFWIVWSAWAVSPIAPGGHVPAHIVRGWDYDLDGSNDSWDLDGDGTVDRSVYLGDPRADGVMLIDSDGDGQMDDADLDGDGNIDVGPRGDETVFVDRNANDRADPKEDAVLLVDSITGRVIGSHAYDPEDPHAIQPVGRWSWLDAVP